MTEDSRVRLTTDPLDLTTIEATATGEDVVPSGTAVGHRHLEASSLETTLRNG